MVKVKEDLRGKKFGKLTVISQVEDAIDKDGHHYAMWRCKCDCGNFKDAKGKLLKRGECKSCGCLLYESHVSDAVDIYRELIGTKINRLTIIDIYRDQNTKYVMAKCNCDCGNEKNINIYHILNNAITSCGCYRIEQSVKKSKISNKKYNKYDLSGEYGIGWTSNDEEFWFDLDDYEKIKDYCWYINKEGYVITHMPTIDKKRPTIKMHRLLTDANKEEVVDHKNHITIDNRKCNLRKCKQNQNSKNIKLAINNTTGCTGVYRDKRYPNTYFAKIITDGNPIYLGSYNNFFDAVKARKEAEEKYFGEFSYDNSIKDAEVYK